MAVKYPLFEFSSHISLTNFPAAAQANRTVSWIRRSHRFIMSRVVPPSCDYIAFYIDVTATLELYCDRGNSLMYVSYLVLVGMFFCSLPESRPMKGDGGAA